MKQKNEGVPHTLEENNERGTICTSDYIFLHLQSS